MNITEPNEHGVFVDAEPVVAARLTGTTRCEIRVARCADGYRVSTKYNGPQSGRGGMPSLRDAPYATLDTAVIAGAVELKRLLKKKHPNPMEHSARHKLLGALDVQLSRYSEKVRNAGDGEGGKGMLRRDVVELAKRQHPLSLREAKRLEELEAIISENFAAFYKVGMALREIRDKELYRTTHAIFEDYCKDSWDVCVRHARRLIDAATAVENIQHGCIEQNIEQKGTHGSPQEGDDPENQPEEGPEIEQDIEQKGTNWSPGTEIPIPKNERQARPLAKLDPKDQVAAWRRVLDTAEDGKITANLVNRAVRDLGLSKAAVAVQRAEKATREEVDAHRMSDAYRDAYMAYVQQIKLAYEDDFSETTIKVIAKHLHTLLGLLQTRREL